MKRCLLILTAAVLILTVGTSSASVSDIVLHLQNGTSPEWDEESQEGWEEKSGILYDTVTKTLIRISDNTDCGERLVVEPGTRYICTGALNTNGTIREIVLPDGLEVIGRESLSGKTEMDAQAAIETIRVPASVRLIQEPIGTGYYSYCCRKPLFEVDPDNPRYMSTPDGLLIDKQEGTLLWCASMPEPRVVTVPDGIRRIAPYAFLLCDEIVSVELPDSLVEIGEGAFSMMAGLQEVTIPSGVLRIGPGNFKWIGTREWAAGAEGEIEEYYGDDSQQPITSEEILQRFGIDRKPGITFEGTDALLQSGEDWNGNFIPFSDFEGCSLTFRIPDGAFCLEFLEAYARDDYVDGELIRVIEKDGSDRPLVSYEP